MCVCMSVKFGWGVIGVHPQTAYRWFRVSAPARRLESGTIWVHPAPVGDSGRTVVYARVSWHDRRADLDGQVARLTDWATRNGHEVGEVVCEVGSGLNAEATEVAAHSVGPVCERGGRGAS